MATFNCKMCGGTLHVESNATTAVCEYCGTTGHCYTDSDHDGICDHREENDRTCTRDHCRNYTEDCSNTGHHYGAGHCRR